MSGKGGLSFGHSMNKIGKFPVKFLSFSISKQEGGENYCVNHTKKKFIILTEK